jgi:hypothetical protein
MVSMSMPFAVASKDLLEGVKEGDIVEMTLHVYRKPRYSYQVMRITVLPPDTPLDFARPPNSGGKR